MLVLLVAGALLGPALADAIDVPLDSMGAQLLLSLGVSFILFHGGLQLSTRVLSRVAVGLTLLAIPGVILTAVIAGAVAAIAFGLPLTSGLLIGAVLARPIRRSSSRSSSGSACGRRCRRRSSRSRRSTIPTGAVLALAVQASSSPGARRSRNRSRTSSSTSSISTAIGVVFGVVLSAAVSSRRAGIWRESAAIAVMAVISAGYFSIDTAGGSGYLGAFLAGLIVGNMEQLRLAMHSEHERDMRVLVSTVADVMVMFVFITLGANIPWSDIRSELVPALAVVFALILLARPLTVLLCLVPDRRGSWSREELVFLAWTRETGVVPAALAGIMVGLHVPDANLIVITVALAIIVTLSVQSTTKRWLARRLRLVDTIPAGGAASGRRHARGRSVGAMSIRAKLYTAIVVVVAGLALTAGVGIAAMSHLGDRFDVVERASNARALALQLKFDVTDFNGWQTAYGYDNGKSRPTYLASFAKFKRTSRSRGHSCGSRRSRRFSTASSARRTPSRDSMTRRGRRCRLRGRTRSSGSFSGRSSSSSNAPQRPRRRWRHSRPRRPPRRTRRSRTPGRMRCDFSSCAASAPGYSCSSSSSLHPISPAVRRPSWTTVARPRRTKPDCPSARTRPLPARAGSRPFSSTNCELALGNDPPPPGGAESPAAMSKPRLQT